MNRDRLVQLGALIVLISATTVCGLVLPGIIDTAERHTMRYTNVAVDGAPPSVVLGTAIGALRGIIVDYLWIKVHLHKQNGLFFDVMHDAALITKLQPRFAAVWAFHGHNMAYNISVMHNTYEERWDWVQQGINLVRKDGLRHNPNDVQLHRELSFWLQHKIDGVSDDAHLYYKREFCREWHFLLGPPPSDFERRVDWMREIAEAPETLEAAEQMTPGVKALVDRFTADLAPYEKQFRFALDKSFIRMFEEWRAMRYSPIAIQQGRIENLRQGGTEAAKFFQAFDAIMNDPESFQALQTLVAHVRKRVLKDEYNMDPQLMFQYTIDTEPAGLDWRNASAHALYYAFKGSAEGDDRVITEDDVYRIVNNDRNKLHSMQNLSRWGLINFDPYSNDWPGRFPDARWIKVIDRHWEQLTVKHKKTRGLAADLFKDFHENFLSYQVRAMWRQGEDKAAEWAMNRLNTLYGPKGSVRTGNPKYELPFDIFVRQETEEEYDMQPHLAPSEVQSILRRGMRMAYAYGREEDLETARAKAKQIIDYFRGQYNAPTKLGDELRVGDLMPHLERSEEIVFGQLIVDGSVELMERLRIYNQGPLNLRQAVYDQIRDTLNEQKSRNPDLADLPIDRLVPEPPFMERYRAKRAAEMAAAEARRREGSTNIRQGSRPIDSSRN